MLTDKRVRDSIENACESLTQIQDTLFDSARNSAKIDEATAWQDAEALFQFAREVDGFKKRLAGLLDAKHATAPGSSAQPPVRGGGQDLVAAHAEEGKRRKRKADYPKYKISDNCLVKIGLQRDRRMEYQHIVQKAAFDKIISIIVKHLAKAKDFSPDTILAELNLPGYQTYVVLAMLRQTKILKNPRRGLYTATDARHFAAAASAVWNKLEAQGSAE